MARIAFEKIMAGLKDALAFADGDASRGETVSPMSNKSTKDTKNGRRFTIQG